jgi:hypothetical protein
MLRGCLFALFLWTGLSVAYWFWLDTVFEPPTSYWASALVGFIVLCCLGSIGAARRALRDWSLISANQRGLAPRDGRLVAVAGTIHPVGEPLIAPFSGIPCVICEYDLSRQRREAGSTGPENTGSDFTGFLMTPCEIRSPAGTIKLLGFPILEGFSDFVHNSHQAARRAIDFLTTREFENRTGLKMLTLLSVFGDVWSDEDGHVEKNIRIGTVSLPDLFPPELEAEIDRQIAAGVTEPDWTADDNEDDDELLHEHEDDPEDEEDWDDQTFASLPQVPQLTEKRVVVGHEVCAIGRYDERRGGLLPKPGSMTPNRLLFGTAQTLIKQSQASIGSMLIGGLIGLVIVHAATYGILQAYSGSANVASARQRHAFEAVEKGDLARLEQLVRRGLDVNLRDAGGRTPLMKAKEPAVASWLIEHGVDVNAADEDGQTALMHAAQAGRANLVQRLIDAQADLNRRSTNYRLTALIMADDAGHHDVAELLRKSGAEDDVVTAQSGQPLPADGGEPLAVVQAYLAAVHARDPAKLKALFVGESTYDFAGVDFELWHNVRPVTIDKWTGFVRGGNATITVTGPCGLGPTVTWSYQLQRDGSEWRIAREREQDR